MSSRTGGDRRRGRGAARAGTARVCAGFALALVLAACSRPGGHEPGGAPSSPPPSPFPAADGAGVPRFEDVATHAGIVVRNVSGTKAKTFLIEGFGAGACWLDFDRDGFLDAYVVQGSTFLDLLPDPPPHDVLYRNRGDGTFEDVTERAGIHESAWGGGCAVLDYDGDGWPDVYVTNHGPNQMWRNRGDGTFEDTTERAGVGDTRWGTSVAAADFDGDGLVDLVVANYIDWDWVHPPLNGGRNFCRWQGLDVACGPSGLPPSRPVYYRNRGDGTFEEATQMVGLLAAPPNTGLGVIATDFDRDGHIDFMMANDRMANYLWRNKGEGGDGTFEEVGLARGVAFNQAGRAIANMGIDAGDVDGDGWPEIFVTTFSDESYLLLHNDGGLLADQSAERGVTEATLLPLGWGVKFVDVDNDGDLDIVAANGHIFPQVDRVELATKYTYAQRPCLLENRGGHFTDVASLAGPGMTKAYTARGAAFADYDNDGRVDVLLVNIDDVPALLHNLGSGRNDRHWLGVALEGRESNRDGIGAVLTVEAAGLPAQRREAVPGGSFESSNDPRVHFGLGAATRATLTVEWPAGTKSRYEDVPADRYVRVVEGQTAVAAWPR